MKKKIISIICLLCVLITWTGAMQPVSASEAGSSLVKPAHVYMTYADEEKVDVLKTVANLETGVLASVHFDVELEKAESGLTYKLIQYDGGAGRRYDIFSSGSTSFEVEISAFYKDIPMYLAIFKGSEILSITLLTIRVRTGRAETIVPTQFESAFKSNVEVNMDEFLPGMKFEMHPYIIPITAKVFTDGRVVIGLGINANNVGFWKNVAKGTLDQSTNVKELSDAFWGDSGKRSAVKGSNMGLVIDFSGWVQGNIYKNDNLKGQITFYIGSGFSVKGQYMILTWEVSLSVGAGGEFEFELQYNEDKSQYDKFVVDSFAVIFKTGLELYGGIGLSSIASAGIYGAGSFTGKDQYYPDPVVRSLVLAGECGIKVKVFSRALFSFAIVSGSREFVEDKNKGKKTNSNVLLNFDKLDSIEDYLLNINGDYAGTVGAIKEPGSEEIWMEGAKPRNSEGLQVFDTDPDYDGVIAGNIYPENRLQVLSTGTDDLPQVSVFFIRSDTSRENGNRARLAHFYYNESSNYLSQPQWLFSTDDGTADYNPHAYCSDFNGKTYLVWQNALKKLDDTASFQEIAKNSDLYFSEYYPTYPWTGPERITFFGDDAPSKVFAAGARASELRDGSPVISYYTNSVEDPIGVDSSASHDIYLAYKENGRWIQEKAFQVTGTVSDLETGYFHGYQSIVVSYTSQDAEGNKTYHIELRQKKNNAWNVVYSGSGDAQNVVSTARFVQAGRGEKYLTWYENGGLYQMANDSFKPVRLTPADLEIPTSDYRLFGSFAKSNIALIGTASKDSSENAFAIVSNDAGKSWRKASVTDIDENALVNEIGIAYTRSEEPIVFYSVQNYGVNTDMSYVTQDAETLLDSPDRAQAGGLAGGFLLGKDDPRFTDTSTDLYMKARRATRKVEIADITFDDIEGAQRGEPSPMTVTVENTGLYRLDNVTLYAGDEKLGDFPVNLKGGETTQLKASVVVPEDAGNDPIDYVIKASSRKGIIDHEMTGTMDIGHIAIRFRHQLEGGTESIAYRVSHTGFLPQKVVFYLFDEDTGKKFYSSPMTIKPKYTLESELAFVSDLFTRMGHNNVRAYIVTEEESRSVQGDISLEQFEKTLNPDSSRSFHIEALKEIYLQDVSKAYKVSSHSIAAAPESESVSGSRNGNGENYHTLILILIGAAFVILSGAAIYLRVRNKKDGQDGEKEDL